MLHRREVKIEEYSRLASMLSDVAGGFEFCGILTSEVRRVRNECIRGDAKDFLDKLHDSWRDAMKVFVHEVMEGIRRYL